MKNTVIVNGVPLTREQVEQAMKELQAPAFPEHTINLGAEVGLVMVQIPSGEWIAKYPTTQAQFNAFCAETGRKRPNYYTIGDDLPATNVSWHDANAFAAWITASRYVHLPAGTHSVSLPSEKLWEKACRAGLDRELTKEETNESAWYYENSDNTIHPVGQKKPNAWGLYDMLGNVWEWCSDDYSNK